VGQTVTIPYNWEPRSYQAKAWRALEGGAKRAVLVWHRRAGKDLFSLNWLAKQAFKRRGLYWHVFPTYRQGRNAVWLGATRKGRAFLDHLPLHDQAIPNQLIKRKRDDEMTIWFANGSKYQVVGADDPDRLVGANPVGVIFSEYSLMNPSVWDLVRPILAENGGWAAFIYTPRGRNHGWTMLEMAQKNPRWFAQVLTVDDTKAVPMDAIEEDRASGMNEAMVQQEYWCSFDAPLEGAWYGDYVVKAAEDGRICDVPWVPEMPVWTGWDLGYADATAIWFAQAHKSGSYRFIDYYQAMGKGLEHYVKMVMEKPYVYGSHLMPHDTDHHEFGSGLTRTAQARKMGLGRIKVIPKLSIMSGINAVRAMIPRSYFDEEKTELGLQALREYLKKDAGIVDPDGNKLYLDTPAKTWASHGADALRTIAQGIRAPQPQRERLAPTLPIV